MHSYLLCAVVLIFLIVLLCMSGSTGCGCSRECMCGCQGKQNLVNHDHFYIPQNIVTGGDFHIQPVGAIADEGSFSTDMDNYLEGDGPI
jgi:hypothetical protein